MQYTDPDMKKLTQPEMQTLGKLMTRAAHNGQIGLGVCQPEGVENGTYAVQDRFQVGDFSEMAPPAVEIWMLEDHLKTIRGMLNRSKAAPRKLSTTEARKMAAKRHAA